MKKYIVVCSLLISCLLGVHASDKKLQITNGFSRSFEQSEIRNHQSQTTNHKSQTLFHIFSIVAFFFVLFTYFGVSYLLGGLHSYTN